MGLTCKPLVDFGFVPPVKQNQRPKLRLESRERLFPHAYPGAFDEVGGERQTPTVVPSGPQPPGLSIHCFYMTPLVRKKSLVQCKHQE